MYRFTNRTYYTSRVLEMIEKGEMVVSTAHTRDYFPELLDEDFIASILEGMPVNIFWVNQTNEGVDEVVDGVKRINAILDYLQDKFCARDPEDLISKKYSELSPRLKKRITSNLLQFCILEPGSRAISFLDKLKIFKRVQTDVAIFSRMSEARPLNDFKIHHPYVSYLSTPIKEPEE